MDFDYIYLIIIPKIGLEIKPNKAKEKAKAKF